MPGRQRHTCNLSLKLGGWEQWAECVVPLLNDSLFSLVGMLASSVVCPTILIGVLGHQMVDDMDDA